VELLGEVRDGSVGTSELLENAASGGIRERGERVIEPGPCILNHAVQYTMHGDGTQGEPGRGRRFRPRSSPRARVFFSETTAVGPPQPTSAAQRPQP